MSIYIKDFFGIRKLLLFGGYFLFQEITQVFKYFFWVRVMSSFRLQTSGVVSGLSP